MSALFQIIDDAFVICYSRGVYKQYKMARRGKELYAAVNSNAFLRLASNNATSSSVVWRDIIGLSLKYGPDELGRLILTEV